MNYFLFLFFLLLYFLFPISSSVGKTKPPETFQCEVQEVVSGNSFQCKNGYTTSLSGVHIPKKTAVANQDKPVVEGSAKEFLTSTIEGKKLNCLMDGKHYSKVTARCTLDDEDISKPIIENGFGFPDKRYKRKYKTN